jgi:hypothetical protein
MRCPKCGYISFDHLDICLKCNKKIKAVAENLPGSVFNTAAPAFLKFSASTPAKEENILDFSEEPEDEVEIQDPDLEILFDDEQEDGEIETDIRLEPLTEPVVQKAQVDTLIDTEITDDAGVDFSLENDDIAIDLGRLADDGNDGTVPAVVAAGSLPIAAEVTRVAQSSDEEKTFNFGVPEELSDISDLAPPRKKVRMADTGESMDLDDLNLDLELDLDLDLKGLEDDALADDEFTLERDKLSFTDLELDKVAKPAKSSSKAISATVDMDEDLNFELDLGGLSIHKDVPAQK